MEVVVGELDRRLKLAACDHVEPYLPPGTQLWGRTRCWDCAAFRGATRWNAFLPIKVAAFGPAWWSRGRWLFVLHFETTMEVEVDWAESRSPIVANQADWIGQTATRLLSAGQPAPGYVEGDAGFQAGAQVRVLSRGWF